MNVKLREWTLIALGCCFGYECQAVELCSRVFTVHVERQPLRTALNKLIVQVQVNGEPYLLFDYNEVDPKVMVPELRGTFTAADALARLLLNTGFHFDFDGTTVTIISSMAGGTSNAPSCSRLPATEIASPAVSTGVAPTSSSRGFGKSPDKTAMAQVVIGGWKSSLGVELVPNENYFQPHLVITRPMIQNSGARDLEELLQQLVTMNAGGPSIGAGSVFSGGTVNLRGLGTNHTLILINGRRPLGIAAVGNPLQPDFNTIPLGAIKKVEILPTTASGLYGGGATGGVINIITDRDYTGQELILKHENTADSGAALRSAYLSGGFTPDDQTHVLLHAFYSHQGLLSTGDRDFMAWGRSQMAANDAEALACERAPPLAASVNVRSKDGSPLFGPGTPSCTSMARYFQRGMGSDPFEANADGYDVGLAHTAQHAGGERHAILNESTRTAFSVALQRKFDSGTSFFLEVGRAEHAVQAPSNPFHLSNLEVSENAPANLFRKPVIVTAPVDADGTARSRAAHWRAATGAVWSLPNGWEFGTDFGWARSCLQFSGPRAHSAAPAVFAGTLDLLRDVALNRIDGSDWLYEMRTSQLCNESRDSGLRLTGSFWKLPGGPVALSGLLEYRRESVGDGTGTEFTNSGLGTQFAPTTSILEQRQRVSSAAVALNIPLLPCEQQPCDRKLELIVAGRGDLVDIETQTPRVAYGSEAPVERSETGFGAFNPIYGLRYLPTPVLELRLSLARGFVTPGVVDLVRGTNKTYPEGTFKDVLRGERTTLPVDVVGGGNPDLSPERSKTVAVGFTLTPKSLQGLSVKVDFQRISTSDAVVNISAWPFANPSALEALPGRVIRQPLKEGDPHAVGPILGFDATSTNLFRQTEHVIDAEIDYSAETLRFGTVNVFLNSTYISKFTPELGGDLGTQIVSPPKLRAFAGITVAPFPEWTLGWRSRFLSSYPLTDPTLVSLQGSDTVKSQMVHDVFVRYQKIDPPFLPGNLEIQVGAQNVFNRRPALDVAARELLYSPYADPRMATYHASFRLWFE